MEDINKEIAANMRAARAKAHMSQEELATSVGISLGSIWAYENADAKVPFSTACAIAKVLNVSPDKLAGFTD